MNVGYDMHLLAPLMAGLIGGLVRGFSGFGFGLAAIPILIIDTPPIQAVPAVIINEILIGLITVPGLRYSVAWDKARALLAGALAGTPLGLLVIYLVSPVVMRPFIGLTILLSIVLIWMRPRLGVRLTKVNLAAAGLISGVLNGAAAASGPPVILLMFASDAPAKIIRGLLVVFVAASAVIAISIFAVGGLVSSSVIALAAKLLPGALLGSLAGGFLFRRLHVRHYRAVSLAFLFVISVATLSITAMPGLREILP